MLSRNTLLNKARYRVDGLHVGGPNWNVYSAADQTSGAMVLVIEHGIEPAPFPDHEGLLKVADSFLMNGRKYDVTEPVVLEDARISIANAWDQFSIVLMALNTVSAVSNKRCEVCAQTLVATDKGVYKLLPVESADGNVDIEAWHAPLERIWRELDDISQRAIYNAWDEASISDLERPIDEASDLYSVAALFYKVATGTTPPSAFERTVVSLDDKDPLIAPNSLAPDIGEAGAHLLRCLELRRDNRFRSFEAAIMSLPTLALPREPEPVAEEPDVLNLEVAPVESGVRFAETVIPMVQTDQLIEIEVEPEEIEALELHAVHEEETPATLVHDSDAPIFTLETPAKSRSGMKFVIAGVIAVALGGIGFGAYQYSSTNGAATTTTPASAHITVPTAQNEPVAAPAQVADAPSTAPNTTIEIPPVTVQADVPTKADAPKQRPQVADTSQKPASKTDKPKKKVTVDDLINDN